jgi:hypothetical protein
MKTAIFTLLSVLAFSVPGYSQTRLPGDWTWHGDLRTHLESFHGLPVNGLSDREAINLHNQAYQTTMATPMRACKPPVTRSRVTFFFWVRR